MTDVNKASPDRAPLWTAAEALAATGGHGPDTWEATGVSIDTRSLVAGDLFVALKDQRDGHDFVGDALAKGAAAALVTHRPDGVPEDAPLLIVDDVLKGLEALGVDSRKRLVSAHVIGVTGSVGKTGVKEMLRACLSGSGATHAPVKSFNNHWGVPLTLARMPRDTAYAAIEMGMNHPGEIGPLSRLASPDAAIITTIAPVHMAAFDNVEGIARAKAEIFEGLIEGGAAILPRDNEHYEILANAARERGARIISFGSHSEADAHMESTRVTSAATVVKASLHGRPLVFKIAAPGAHLAMNALAALAAVDAVGGDLARATMALSSWSAPDGRGARVRIALGAGAIDGHIDLIDESYNANPLSMRAALAVLAAAQPTDAIGRIERGRRIAFLGDMLELGPDEIAMHAGLADAAELAATDTVHTCGPLMKHLHEALPREKRGKWFENSAEMAASARRVLDAGDVAMVKGSLGSRMAAVVNTIKTMGDVTSGKAAAAVRPDEGA
ncbi:MAG: UDP-N-acetylmuramoyl-tripeptide--D-alanyl-D-alanine ligase [Pikeienuella sp.]